MLCVNNDGNGNSDMNSKNIFRVHAFVTFIEKYTKGTSGTLGKVEHVALLLGTVISLRASLGLIHLCYPKA